MRKLTRENVEMPVKIGLGFYLRPDGSLWTGNRNNVERLAERIAARETAKTHRLFVGFVFQAPTYFRISIGGK